MPTPDLIPDDLRKRVEQAKFLAETPEQLSTEAAIEGKGGPQGLPVLDWDAAGLSAARPVRLEHDGAAADHLPLPRADVVVMTWTTDEWAALHYVFGNGPNPLTDDKDDKAWRDGWRPYRREFWQVYQSLYLRRLIASARNALPGAPALDRDVMGWGSYRLVKVRDKKVLLFKSALHLNQDGEGLPLLRLVNQIIDDCEPSLILSVGTSGGVRVEDGLGDTVVTPSARFRLGQEFGSADFNGQTFTSEWQPPQGLVEKAESLLMPVAEARVSAPTAHYGGAEILPLQHTPKIKVVTDKPILTTDFFEYGTTANKLGEDGCCVEMDDAVIAMVAQKRGKAFGFLRNISDPVITGHIQDHFPRELQTGWALLTYQTRGLYTSYNGAIATWAMIAG